MNCRCYRNPIYIAFWFTTVLSCYALWASASQVRYQNRELQQITYEVSGLVTDSTGNPLPFATLKLRANRDSLSIKTDENGVFIFENVSSPEFILTVSSIGYATAVRKYFYTNKSKIIVLDPIIMLKNEMTLKEVVIKGAPSIVYKKDTVEFRASDYKVRENATVDELLKRMEGMEVGADGTLVSQGQQVTKAKVNGKEFAGGDVAQAIQMLPAEIVDKIQIVDDYGNNAAKTGFRDGKAKKVLNIVTRTDKSVGDFGFLNAAEGTNYRQDHQLMAQRLAGNKQLGIIGSFRNIINGLASTGTNNSVAESSTGDNTATTGSSESKSEGNGGTIKKATGALNYRDQIGSKLQLNSSIVYDSDMANIISNSDGQLFGTSGATAFVNQSNIYKNNRAYQFNAEFEYNADSLNYFTLSPTISDYKSDNNGNDQTERSGVINQNSRNSFKSNLTTPRLELDFFYQHSFRKKGRSLALGIDFLGFQQDQSNERLSRLSYFNTEGIVTGDSVFNRKISRANRNYNFKPSLNYSEPLGSNGTLQISLQLGYLYTVNSGTSGDIAPNGQIKNIDSLRNQFNYFYSEMRATAAYRYLKPRLSLTLGVGGLPNVLSTKDLLNSSLYRTRQFRIIPVFSLQYQISPSQMLSVNYNGTSIAPQYDQLQPTPDYTDPQNVILGNPNLKPTFTHTINTTYNNYMPNARLNISLNSSLFVYRNSVITNTVISRDIFNTYRNLIYYDNANGSYFSNTTYNISKQLDSRKYNLELNGTVGYGRSVGLTNDEKINVNTFHLNERLGPRLNPTNRIEINPYFSYDLIRSFSSLTGPYNSRIQKTALNFDGKFFFPNNWIFGFSSSKNFISGIENDLSKSPFVLNFLVEKEFFKRKNGLLGFRIFDLLKQNNYVNQIVTPTTVTNMRTNALSRYFMLNFRLNLQRWSGRPDKNGKPLKRRGDGSFIE